MSDLIRVEHLKKYFAVGKGLGSERKFVRAVDDVSFSVPEGKTVGLVGESGCGKSTTGRLILNLIQPTSGAVYFEGENIYGLSQRKMRALRRKMQIVFQDPYSSLNPRMRISEIVGEPLQCHRPELSSAERGRLVGAVLEQVGLDPKYADRFAHEFSGGQRQRIGIARAIILNPQFVICDEAVSALDVSVQSQVLNLLQDLQAEKHLTYLFIAHNLSVVKHISDVICVMYLGKVMEIAPKHELFDRPLHPYTQALISAVPVPEPGAGSSRIILEGDIPSPVNPPEGCRFRTRCFKKCPQCEQEPQLKDVGGGHFVACHLYE